MEEDKKLTLTIKVETEDELIPYLKVQEMQSFIFEFAGVLRGLRKYDLPASIKTAQDAIDHIENQFYQLKEERGLNDT